MSINAALDAAAAGLSLPQSTTPLKKLPCRSAPAVSRKRAFIKIHDELLNESRTLTTDHWIKDVINDMLIGRLLSQSLNKHGHAVLHTTLGRYIVDSSYVVIRGKVNKRSIHGHILAIVSNDEL